jgi:hypothetical protein
MDTIYILEEERYFCNTFLLNVNSIFEHIKEMQSVEPDTGLIFLFSSLGSIYTLLGYSKHRDGSV